MTVRSAQCVVRSARCISAKCGSAKCGSAILLAVVALLVPVAAQQAQTPPPVFRAGAMGIDVDARVFDRSGKFVEDLTIDDFEIFEDGVRQTVQNLSLVGGPAAPPVPADPLAAAAAGLRSMPPRPAPPRHTWIFVFDLNHLTPGGGFSRAQAAVETYLREQFRDGDVGGVVAGSRMVNNRLTSVRSELVAAARTVNPSSEHRSQLVALTREWPRLRDEAEALLVADGNRDAMQRAVTRACADDPSACRIVSPDPQILEKALRFQREAARDTLDTLNAMAGLAAGLAKIPGPKTIVLFSEGFITAQMEGALRSTVGQTGRAGARVYSVDVRGLDRGAASGNLDRPSPDDPSGGPPRFDMGEDGPNSLAVDTGGFVIRNENNMGRALATIAADANQYYVLSYQPANTQFDGKYREIEVRVKRDGTKVRARRGYLAIDPPPPAFQSLQPIPSLPPLPASASAAETPFPALPPFPPFPTIPSIPPIPPIPSLPASGSAPASAPRLRPDAEATTKQLAGEDLSHADASATEGWSAYQRGDVERALPALTRAAALPGVRPWVLYVLGLSHAALNQPKDAIAAWERVRVGAPEFAPVYFDLAATYGHVGDLSNALRVLRDAETRWPNDTDVCNALGVIFVRRGALDEALEMFEKATTIASEDPVAYMNLGRAYEMRYVRNRRYVESQQRWVAPDGDRVKAIDALKRYIALNGPYLDQATEAITRLSWAGK